MSRSQEYIRKLLAHSFRHFSVHDGAIEDVQWAIPLVATMEQVMCTSKPTTTGCVVTQTHACCKCYFQRGIQIWLLTLGILIRFLTTTICNTTIENTTHWRWRTLWNGSTWNPNLISLLGNSFPVTWRPTINMCSTAGASTDRNLGLCVAFWQIHSSQCTCSYTASYLNVCRARLLPTHQRWWCAFSIQLENERLQKALYPERPRIVHLRTRWFYYRRGFWE